MTGGSTTSEAACAAVLQCCEQLVERMKATFTKLEKNSGTPTWLKVASAAVGGDVNMSSQAQWVDKDHTYHNFGACASHVEIDVLTGEMTILQTDIVYDCGKS